jgi:hypothetical protein
MVPFYQVLVVYTKRELAALQHKEQSKLTARGTMDHLKWYNL